MQRYDTILMCLCAYVVLGTVGALRLDEQKMSGPRLGARTWGTDFGHFQQDSASMSSNCLRIACHIYDQTRSYTSLAHNDIKMVDNDIGDGLISEEKGKVLLKGTQAQTQAQAQAPATATGFGPGLGLGLLAAEGVAAIETMSMSTRYSQQALEEIHALLGGNEGSVDAGCGWEARRRGLGYSTATLLSAILFVHLTEGAQNASSIQTNLLDCLLQLQLEAVPDDTWVDQYSHNDSKNQKNEKERSVRAKKRVNCIENNNGAVCRKDIFVALLALLQEDYNAVEAVIEPYIQSYHNKNIDKNKKYKSNGGEGKDENEGQYKDQQNEDENEGLDSIQSVSISTPIESLLTGTRGAFQSSNQPRVLFSALAAIQRTFSSACKRRQVRMSLCLSLSLRFKGLFLYTFVVLFRVECCIKLTALVFFYHTL